VSARTGNVWNITIDQCTLTEVSGANKGVLLFRWADHCTGQLATATAALAAGASHRRPDHHRQPSVADHRAESPGG
jgi:hypothetical protein